MKKILLAFCLCFLSFFAFAQEIEPYTINGGSFHFALDEGASFAQVTRIEKQTGRSNFVRETMMAGAYLNFHTVNLASVDIVQQLSAYYPVYYAFNGMRQYPKNMLNYAIDSFTGLRKEWKKIKFINLNFALGMHYMYQLTDEWPMFYLGLGLQTGMEFPITKKWTLINEYFVSYDNANIGPNKLMQPFAGSYQYHIELGIRFAPHAQNSYCYIKPKSL